MDLRQLRYFVAVAEELHFRRAAERVHIAQPALSVQIKALEDHLGGKLISRNNRHVELTDAGRLFLEQARRILAQVDDATQLVRRALVGQLGLLRLSYSGSAAESGILAKVTRAFRQHSLDVEICAQEMHPISQMEALLRGGIHASLMPTLAVDVPRELKVTRLGVWPLRLALPDNHPLLLKRRIRVSDIGREPFVVCAANSADDGTAVFRRAVGFEPIVAHRVPVVMMITALVGAGLGLGVLPESMAVAANQAGAVLRPISGLDIETDISLVTLALPREPVTQRLLSITKAAFELD
ncbi:LysR family transcriptional regulator [Brenneria goodwinii]|uniref:LysR substrate-binding domain-containing protein n=1 Tax=Brenneria goodwinii TaxID=1109412 RepID=UPI0036EA3395